MKAADLRHKAVVSLDDGARVGRVDDVLFDTTSLGPTGFLVSVGSGQRTCWT